MHYIVEGFRRLFQLILLPFIIIIFLFIATIIVGMVRLRKRKQPKLVWGTTPLPNNIYWSNAMRLAGYESETYTSGFFSIINKREDWGKLLDEELRLVPRLLRPYAAFLQSLWRYDVFFISFDGFFIGNTPIWRLQATLFKLAGKKTVALPYGSDAYVYQRIRSTTMLHGLLMSYPGAAREQLRLKRQIDYWCKNADAVIPAGMGVDGFGRWDVLLPSSVCLDLDAWKPSQRNNQADGVNGTVVIAHAPNHRGFKGTEFILHAVESLKKEGLLVELLLIEKMQNSRVKECLYAESDILVEQVIFTGHGMNGLEGLASGITVVANLEDDEYMLPMRRWSYFNECPTVSASPENLTTVLRKLVTRPELRQQLGKAGRAYIEKYHGADSAQYLFTKTLDYLYGRIDSMINLYHPLLGEYPNRKPKVTHPLVNNKIVD